MNTFNNRRQLQRERPSNRSAVVTPPSLTAGLREDFAARQFIPGDAALTSNVPVTKG